MIYINVIKNKLVYYISPILRVFLLMHRLFILLASLFIFLPLQVNGSDSKKELGISEYSVTDQGNSNSSYKPKTSMSTADHSEFKELKGSFANGPEVTKACLKCHNTAGHQFKKNKHWTWEYKDPKTGQMLGKKHLVNNFCTNARGNEGMCAQCHAGYNMKDDDFDFDNEENMDCLVCHESTGKYYKTPTTKASAACSSMTDGKKPIDWAKTAQSVQMPSRNNCGKCHFYGGGGDNVKHGDLSSVLFNPDKKTDVHMDTKGLNFSCVTCHVGEGHEWAGSRYNMTIEHKKLKPGAPREVASCASCHSEKPHSKTSIIGNKLNSHTANVACETCHIPTFAKGGVATEVKWDWRTMGKLENGQGFKLKEYTQGDGHHRATYKSIKGSFTYAENIKPTYKWFNGNMGYTTIDTKFDPEKQPIAINIAEGSSADGKSKIYPFKDMFTTQPYDKGNNTLVYMELWGDNDTALWGNYDFEKAIKVGMEKFNLPYSGKWGFIDTVSSWPINHMVSPKEDALSCNECHAKEGLLKDIKGVYLPGTGNNKRLDIIGLLVILGTLFGVLAHALIRVIMSKRRNS